MIAFVDEPQERLSKKYKIKTVDGPDDYKSMQNSSRRYTRVLKEGLPIPDLIIMMVVKDT